MKMTDEVLQEFEIIYSWARPMDENTACVAAINIASIAGRSGGTSVYLKPESASNEVGYTTNEETAASIVAALNSVPGLSAEYHPLQNNQILKGIEDKL